MSRFLRVFRMRYARAREQPSSRATMVTLRTSWLMNRVITRRPASKEAILSPTSTMCPPFCLSYRVKRP